MARLTRACLQGLLDAIPSLPPFVSKADRAKGENAAAASAEDVRSSRSSVFALPQPFDPSRHPQASPPTPHSLQEYMASARTASAQGTKPAAKAATTKAPVATPVDDDDNEDSSDESEDEEEEIKVLRYSESACCRSGAGGAD